jgi:hypothetical protein
VLEALQEQHSPSQKKLGTWSIELTRPSSIEKKKHVLFKLRVRLCRTVDAFVAG